MSLKSRKLLLLTTAAISAIYYLKKRRAKSVRKHWVRPFLRNRTEYGDFYAAIPTMLKEDPRYYFETFRVTPELFEDILSRVGPLIRKEDYVRESISPAERLYVTLAFLASGDEQKSIAKDYRLGQSTVCKIIHETTGAIYEVLKHEFLKAPSTDDWHKISDEFLKLWNFPHCIGAMDGKHFAITAPPNSSSLYYNYKGFFSVVLLATCDARYNFTTISIGSAGSESDGGIFSRSKLGEQLRNHTFPLPTPDNIPGTPLVFPYVFVGDEAFPLMINLMRPFQGSTLDDEQCIFNYRLSRARRVIENSFGILVARWRALLNTMHMLPEYAISAIKSCLVLHNYVRQHPMSSSYYIPNGFDDCENGQTGELIRGHWRNLVPCNLLQINRQASNNYTQSAAQYRNQLKWYFSGAGSVPWQESLCNFRG